jgi:CheY-like chemotaxis protein
MAKVLYVEDHKAQCEIMRQVLELYGYEFDVAYNGEEGVKKAREWHPDIILMDVRMPGGIDGLAAVQQLRESPGTAGIPIIVISAWGDSRHKERALKAGADLHFTKPVSIGKLIAAINHHLSSHPVPVAPTFAHCPQGPAAAHGQADIVQKLADKSSSPAAGR